MPSQVAFTDFDAITVVQPVKRTIECVELSSGDEDETTLPDDSIQSTISRYCLTPPLSDPPSPQVDGTSDELVPIASNSRRVKCVKVEIPKKKKLSSLQRLSKFPSCQGVLREFKERSKVPLLNREERMSSLGLLPRDAPTVKQSDFWVDKLEIAERKDMLAADPSRTRTVKITQNVKRVFPTSAALDITSPRGLIVLGKIPGAIVDPFEADKKTVRKWTSSERWPSEEFKHSVLKKRDIKINVTTIKEAPKAVEDREVFYYIWQEKLPKERLKMEKKKEKEAEKREAEKAAKKAAQEAEKVAREKEQIKKEEKMRKECLQSDCTVKLGRINICYCSSCQSYFPVGLQDSCLDCGTKLRKVQN